MKYLKPHLSLDQQTDLLQKRGLIFEQEKLIAILSNIGYYRLSAYTHPYRMRDQHTGNILDNFRQGTSLDKVWLHYRFDRDLRLCLLDAIERIEVALRAQLAHQHTASNNPFHYTEADYFPRWQKYQESYLKKFTQESLKATSPDYVKHFVQKYGDEHPYLPLWMAIGISDMGFAIYFYIHSAKQIRTNIARQWDTTPKTLESWLRALNLLRNDCAHHARVWNKHFASNPSLPRITEEPRWHYVYSDKAHKWVKPLIKLKGQPSLQHSSNTIAYLIFICRTLLRYVAPHSQWYMRLQTLLENYEAQGVNTCRMGLPQHWQSHPLWIQGKPLPTEPS